MANIMSSFKLRNSVSRNGFDLSNRHSFTAKIGELLPVQVKECLPGDKFQIDLTHFSRTKPLTTPAYVRIKEYYDFCFVPTRLLWKYFDQFVNQMPNNVSASSLSSESVTYPRHPYFPSSAVFHLLDTYYHDLGFVDEIGMYKGQTSSKLLEYLGYGSFDGTEKNVALNPFPLLAYQKIYNDIFRFEQWESPLPHCYNIDFINGDSGMVIDLSVLEDADYGSVDMFNLRYANYPKDLIMGVLPNSQFGDVSLVTPPITAITQQIGSSTNNMFGWINDQNLPIGGSDASSNPTYKANIDKLFNFSILAL